MKKYLFFVLIASFVLSSCHNSKKTIDNNQTIDTDPKAQGDYIFSSAVDKNLPAGNASIHLVIVPGSKAVAGEILSYEYNGVVKNLTVESGQSLEDDVLVKPGNYVFKVALMTSKKEVITKSLVITDQSRNDLYINFEDEEEKMIVYKPVIYTYGDDQEFEMNVQPNGEFTFTYPDINQKWTGTAHSDGSATIKGKTYPYLFWEASRTTPFQLKDNEGFYVSKSEVVAFLEKQLTKMGMNTKEQTDFITFWGPQMTQFPFGKVQFLFNEEYNDVSELTVTPKPTSVFRVYMVYTGYNEQPFGTLAPQTIPTMKRENWTIVEWGGSKIIPNSNENQ